MTDYDRLVPVPETAGRCSLSDRPDGLLMAASDSCQDKATTAVKDPVTGALWYRCSRHAGVLRRVWHVEAGAWEVTETGPIVTTVPRHLISNGGGDLGGDNIEQMLYDVEKKHADYIITKKDDPVAVIMPFDDWVRLTKEVEGG